MTSVTHDIRLICETCSKTILQQGIMFVVIIIHIIFVVTFVVINVTNVAHDTYMCSKTILQPGGDFHSNM